MNWGKKWALAGVLLAGFVVGCHCDLCSTHGKHTPDPPPPPDPPGTSVHQFFQLQANKAEASDFVVFLDEWYKGGTDLGPHGHYHITQMVRRLPEVPFPVAVQPQVDPALNELRRQVVVTALQRKGVADAEQRVIIAYPEAESLYGEQADIVYQRMIWTSYMSNGFGGGWGGMGWGGMGGYGMGGYGGGGMGYAGYGAGYGGYGGGGRFGWGGFSPWGF